MKNPQQQKITTSANNDVAIEMAVLHTGNPSDRSVPRIRYANSKTHLTAQMQMKAKVTRGQLPISDKTDHLLLSCITATML